jgi:hypothetical protein
MVESGCKGLVATFDRWGDVLTMGPKEWSDVPQIIAFSRFRNPNCICHHWDFKK